MTPDHEPELRTLRRLWREQVEYISARPHDPASLDYMNSQFALDITLERRLRVIDLITPHVRGRLLDWGCQAGVDCCIYRLRFSDRVELCGCDVVDPLLYKPFYDFSGLRYSRIAHDYLLDYPDNSFDVVTSNGVLEHVPDEHYSIQEIHRILRPGGSFVVTCLPNRYSYTEFYHRARRHAAHERLYTLTAARRMLEGRGFDVADTTRFFVMPTMLNGLPQTIRDAYQHKQDLVWRINDALERVGPLNWLASNLMLIARKRSA